MDKRHRHTSINKNNNLHYNIYLPQFSPLNIENKFGINRTKIRLLHLKAVADISEMMTYKLVNITGRKFCRYLVCIVAWEEHPHYIRYWLWSDDARIDKLDSVAACIDVTAKPIDIALSSDLTICTKFNNKTNSFLETRCVHHTQIHKCKIICIHACVYYVYQISF